MNNDTTARGSRFGHILREVAEKRGLGSPIFERIALDAPGYELVSRVVLDWWPKDDFSTLVKRHSDAFLGVRDERLRAFTPELSIGMVNTIEAMWRAINSYQTSASPEDIWALAVFQYFRNRPLPDTWKGVAPLLLRQRVQEEIREDIRHIEYWNHNAISLPDFEWPSLQFLDETPLQTEEDLAAAMVEMRKLTESRWAMVEIFHPPQSTERKK